jgi:hypothetical protein
MATAAKMNRLGIKTGFDLKEQTLAFLQQHFGKPGPYFYWIARAGPASTPPTGGASRPSHKLLVSDWAIRV